MTPGKAPPLSPADVAGMLEIVARVCGTHGYFDLRDDLEAEAKNLRAAPAEGAPTPGCEHERMRDLYHRLVCTKCGDIQTDKISMAPQGAAGGEAGRVKPDSNAASQVASAAEVLAPQDGAPPAAPGGISHDIRVAAYFCEQHEHNLLGDRLRDYADALDRAGKLVTETGTRLGGLPGITAVSDEWLYNIRGLLLGMNSPRSQELVEKLNAFQAAPQASGEKE